MKRAFLSHSSLDKDYVSVVARYLGRAHIVFDETSFPAGVDFRQSIVRGLGQSSMLCFFASKRSLQSTWCAFELDRADLLRIKGSISAHLCVMIDPDIKVNELPEWMRSTKVVYQLRPSRAARDIQHALLDLYPAEQRRPFVGRERQIGELTSLLSDLEGPRKNVYIFSGLDGVGRRTLLTRSASDLLGMQTQPIVALDSTGRLVDLYVRLLDDAGEIDSREALAREIQAFRDLSVAEQAAKMADHFRALSSEGYLPCVIDQGAALDDDGAFTPEFAALVAAIAGQPDTYLGLVHRRTPMYRTEPFAEHVVHVRVPPLSDAETTVLIRQLAGRQKLELDTEAVETIGRFVDGYPPAAYFALGYVATYGVAALVADPSILVDFRTRRFTRFVHDLRLPPDDGKVLQYMAGEKPMTLDALSAALGLSAEGVADSLRRLIDLSLATVYDDMYAVSAPIRNAVERVFGFVEREDYVAIVERLTIAYWVGDNAAPRVDVVDATLHAVARSGQTTFAPYQDLVRASTVERLATECYHRQEWQTSLEYARHGLEMEPHRDKLREFCFKSLVKLERWEEAKGLLRTLEQRRHPHCAYLRGFMFRVQRRYADAVRAFEEALDSGDRSFPVFRDLADSLYREGRLREAFEALKHVLERNEENVFVLDLAVRILVDVGDFEEAKQYLSRLERFDIDGRFIYHRRARLRVKQAMWDLALADSEKAVQSGRSPFEAFAEYASILIELRRFDEASATIDQLESRFRLQRRDVQRGLRCKLLIRQGKWRAAKALWDQLEEKTLPVHMHLLRGILQAKGADPALPLTEHNQALAALRELENQLATAEAIADQYAFPADDEADPD